MTLKELQAHVDIVKQFDSLAAGMSS